MSRARKRDPDDEELPPTYVLVDTAGWLSDRRREQESSPPRNWKRERAERAAREARRPYASDRAAVAVLGIGQGVHAEWRSYPHGAHDYEFLQRVPGIGPQRAAWLMELCGSVRGILDAPAAEIVAAWPAPLYAPQGRYIDRMREWQHRLRRLWAEALPEVEIPEAETGSDTRVTRCEGDNEP